MNEWFSASLLLGNPDTFVISDVGGEWTIKSLVIVKTIINWKTLFHLFDYKCWVGASEL